MAEYLFDHDKGVSWEVLRTGEQLDQAGRELVDCQAFAHDVETSGLRRWSGARNIGHSFAWRRPNGQIRAVYAPFRHKNAGMDLFADHQQYTVEQVNHAFQPALAGRGLKIGHNYAFDVLMSDADGLKVEGPVCDTMVATRLIDENRRSYRLANCLTDSRVIPFERGWKNTIVPEEKKIAKHLRMNLSAVREAHGYEYLPIDACGKYAVQDAIYELRLGEWALPYQGQWADIWAMEMELFWVCLDIQKVGVPLDTHVLQQLADEQRAALAELAPQIFGLIGFEFEITKDNDLRKLLFEHLELPPQGTTKKSETTLRVDDDVLWALKGYHPAIELIRTYKDHAKILNTYSENIIGLTDEHNYLHTQINQSGAKTGRVSSSDPNLQNIPIRSELGRRVRAAFAARRGMVRYCLDYSQVELRVLAHLSQDPTLLRVYHEGLDAHSTTALEAFGTADKVDGVDMRRIGKILNFGVSFGMTEIGLMKNVNKDLPEGQPPISEEKAKGFLDYYYETYKAVDGYRKNLWYQIERNNGLFWNIFGRPRRLPDITNDTAWRRRAAQRQATSTMVQGSAADLVKFSMVAVHKYLKAQTHCEAEMVLMVHDDLQFDMMPSGSARTIRDIHQIMEQTCQHKLSVPIKVDVEYFTTHWADKHSLKMAA